MPALKLIEDDIDVPVPVPPLGSLASVANGTAVLVSRQWLVDVNAGRVKPGELSVVLDALEQEQEATAGMVSYRKNVTGLNNTVFISVGYAQHAPRIKVAVDPATHVDPFGKNASVSIGDGRVVAGDLSADVLKDVQGFVELNREALLDYWEKRIDTDELRQRLQPLPGRR
jgi:Domain of unknown function (DUF4160)